MCSRRRLTSGFTPHHRKSFFVVLRHPEDSLRTPPPSSRIRGEQSGVVARPPRTALARRCASRLELRPGRLSVNTPPARAEAVGESSDNLETEGHAVVVFVLLRKLGVPVGDRDADQTIALVEAE